MTTQERSLCIFGMYVMDLSIIHVFNISSRRTMILNKSLISINKKLFFSMRISQIYSEISKDHHSLGKIMLKISQFNCMLFLMISFQHNAFTNCGIIYIMVVQCLWILWVNSSFMNLHPQGIMKLDLYLYTCIPVHV